MPQFTIEMLKSDYDDLVREKDDLIDLAKNAAGIDEAWLQNATVHGLRAVLRELSMEARAILDKLCALPA